MMKKVAVYALCTIFSFLFLAGTLTAFAESLPPIPNIPDDFAKLQFLKSNSVVSSGITDFLGVWEGVWIGQLRPGALPTELRRARLIIYEVLANKVKYLYGTGANPHNNSPSNNWIRGEAEIKDDQGAKFFTRISSYGNSGDEAILKFKLKGGIINGSIGRSSIELRRIS